MKAWTKQLDRRFGVVVGRCVSQLNSQMAK
jgi:hypothetical protein